MEGDGDVFERFQSEDVPSAGQNEELYVRYLKSLQGASEHWDRGKGWISWLQGHALNSLVQSIRNKVCERGSYGRVREQVGMKKTTAWCCQRIARAYTPDEARTLGFCEMLYRIGVRKKIATDPKRKGRKGLVYICERFRKCLERRVLREKCARIAVRDYDPAIKSLAAIGALAGRAVGELERRRRGSRVPEGAILKYPDAAGDDRRRVKEA